MLYMTAPNDPAFFYHHANVDRLYQHWLENSGQLYAGKEPSAADYPVQLTPLTNAACKEKYTNFKIFLFNVQGVMTLEVSPSGTPVGCNSTCLQSINGKADWDNKALTEAREILVYCMQEGTWKGVSKEAPTQLFSQSAQALRFALAWPENDANAATIPPVHEQFLDPQVFKAKLPLASDPSAQNTHTYESFTLAGAYAPGYGGSSSSVFLVEPTMIDRATQISLAQPAWLNRLNVTQPSASSNEVRMVAIAVDNAGFKLNLKGWTPNHYWGPGLVNQLISKNSTSHDQRRVIVSFSADLSEPEIRCADFAGRQDGSGLSKCETLNSPVGFTGNADGVTPWKQLVGQQQLMTNALTRWEHMRCMSTTELREEGFVLNGALPTHILHTCTSPQLLFANIISAASQHITSLCKQIRRRPSNSCPPRRSSASSLSYSCPPPSSTPRASRNATRQNGPTRTTVRSARRPLWRLGWPAPTRGTTYPAARPLTSPRTSTLARARVITGRYVKVGLHAHRLLIYTCTCTTVHMRASYMPKQLISLTYVTAQDKMVPFDQLGIDYSPASLFDASTGSYAPSNA